MAFLARPVAGQDSLPRPTPRLIRRSEWAATPLWRAPLEARQGFVVAEVRVQRRLVDGLIALVRETPPGIGGESQAQHVWLERRDAEGRVAWRQAVPGLPDRFERFAAQYVAGSGARRSLLVTSFLPADKRRSALYGRMVEIEETAGTLRALGGVARPRTKEWIADEAFELYGVLRQDDDRLVVYGGFGTGPFRWWIAQMRLDGTKLWETMGQTSAGEVTSMRGVAGGFEASVHVVMAWPNTANVGAFRMRFDASGRLVGSLKTPVRRGHLFTPDGSSATLSEEADGLLQVEDRLGRRRAVALLPGATDLRLRLDDGSFVLSDGSDNDLVVSGDGRTALHVERKASADAILADGTIFTAVCEKDDPCATRTLALYRRPW